jgi:hypothetical protein
VDQSVVNPLLKEKQIPSSGGPFLSSLRRGIKFVPATAGGIQDRAAYSAFLGIIQHISKLDSDENLRQLLVRLLYEFLVLREASKIPIAKVQRLSIMQCDSLLQGLLTVRSGGQYPVFIVVAVMRAVKDVLNLPWEISYQGINQPDAPGEQPGDISITFEGELFLAAEVTERIVDKTRVISTFGDKIVPAGIKDYVFFVKLRTAGPDMEASRQAQQYFNQGHEVNFVDIRQWAVTTLLTFGHKARAAFIGEMVTLLDNENVKKNLKVAWNEQIQKLTKV